MAPPFISPLVSSSPLLLLLCVRASVCVFACIYTCYILVCYVGKIGIRKGYLGCKLNRVDSGVRVRPRIGVGFGDCRVRVVGLALLLGCSGY